MTKRKRADWEAIEPRYRTGAESLRVLATEFDVTEGAIRQWAKKEGWERDLSAKVKAKTESLLRKAELRNELRNDPARSVSAREEVDIVAASRTNLVLLHRTDIAALRGKARDYQQELDECGEELGKRVSILKALADTQKTLIGCEREAFGLESGAQPEGSSDVHLKVSFGR